MTDDGRYPKKNVARINEISDVSLTDRILTEAGQLVGIRGVNHVHEGLQLELASRDVLIVIHHRELERGLHLVGTLLEDRTWKQSTEN